ncbi:MAG: methionine--tRNA ligase [Verrucomicrobiota bacterium]
MDYVNSAPHLGHAYEKVLADFFARYQASLERDVLFLTGVDEHGQKVQQSAQKQGVEPQAFTDQMAEHFREQHRSLAVVATTFVRTTAASHKQVVRDWLQKLRDKGEIFFQEHEGFYSVRQEQFVTEKDKVDGQWPEIYGEVVPMKESNYYFRLEPYRARLLQHLEDHPDWIVPGFRRNELLQALKEPLADLCISRPRERLAWGIPLPFDENYVTYVWFDALTNYYSFADAKGARRWPPDVQIIGKDILIPAHGVYWPIMLMALDLELPRHLLVHGWWLKARKISKSDPGSLVYTAPYVEKFGADALRYYLLREMVLGQDAEFTDERFETRYDSELRNKLGNLVNRTLKMIHSYRGGVVPNYDGFHLEEVDAPLRSDAVVEDYRKHAEAFAPHLALHAVWDFVAQANEYIDRTQPFKLPRTPRRRGASTSSSLCWPRRCAVSPFSSRPRCPPRRKKFACSCSCPPARAGSRRRSSAPRCAATPSASPRSSSRRSSRSPPPGRDFRVPHAAVRPRACARRAQGSSRRHRGALHGVRRDQLPRRRRLHRRADHAPPPARAGKRAAAPLARAARRRLALHPLRRPGNLSPVDPLSLCRHGRRRRRACAEPPHGGNPVRLQPAADRARARLRAAGVRRRHARRGAADRALRSVAHLPARAASAAGGGRPVPAPARSLADPLVRLPGRHLQPLHRGDFLPRLLLTFLKNYTSPLIAVVLSGALFAGAHANLGVVLPLWFLGIVLGIAYEHTGSLLVPMAIHGCFNLATALSLLLDKGSPS